VVPYFSSFIHWLFDRGCQLQFRYAVHRAALLPPHGIKTLRAKFSAGALHAGVVVFPE